MSEEERAYRLVTRLLAAAAADGWFAARMPGNTYRPEGSPEEAVRELQDAERELRAVLRAAGGERWRITSARRSPHSSEPRTTPARRAELRECLERRKRGLFSSWDYQRLSDFLLDLAEEFLADADALAAATAEVARLRETLDDASCAVAYAMDVLREDCEDRSRAAYTLDDLYERLREALARQEGTDNAGE